MRGVPRCPQLRMERRRLVHRPHAEKSSAGRKRLRARACGCSAAQHVGGGRGTCARPSRLAVHWAPPPAGTRQRVRPANREGGERRLASRRARHRPATTRPTRCGRSCDVAPSPSVVFHLLCWLAMCVCVRPPSTAHARPDTGLRDRGGRRRSTAETRSGRAAIGLCARSPHVRGGLPAVLRGEGRSQWCLSPPPWRF